MSQTAERIDVPDDDLTIELSDRRPISVWAYFDEIRDVPNLNPAEEQQTAWEARIPSHDKPVGMAVVDTFPSTVFVSRIAVLPETRQQGVGTALLDRLYDRYGELTCRVNEKNDAGKALVTAHEFTEVESRFHELHRYETHPDE